MGHKKEVINQRQKWDPGNRGSIWRENFQNNDEKKSQDNHLKKAERSSKKNETEGKLPKINILD